MREMTLTAAEIKTLLRLQPHPREGGWYVRTYESAETLPPHLFDDRRYNGPRRMSTAIYYLLEPGTFSEIHMLMSDEVFHHYAGDPSEMLQLHPNGGSQRPVIGRDLRSGQRPQVTVPRGVWQGARLLPFSQVTPGAHHWALLGCTVSPGFDFADYRSGRRADLISRWPGEADLITALTRH